MNQQKKSNNAHWYKIIAKKYNDQVFNATVYYQKQYGFDIGTGEHATWNNEADAFKHTFMQAQLALLGNENLAKYLGDRHEKDGNTKQGQTKEEEQMDQWNNAQGREIAKEIWKEYGIKSKNAFDPEIKNIIARKVIERMQAGKLILDSSGRKTPKKKLNGVNNNDTSHSQKGCVGSYQVSGYIRADGTEVKGYTRTCGAEHAGMNSEERLAGQTKYKNKKFQDIPQDELNNAISFFI
jgi:hypothetical protein